MEHVICNAGHVLLPELHEWSEWGHVMILQTVTRSRELYLTAELPLNISTSLSCTSLLINQRILPSQSARVIIQLLGVSVLRAGRPGGRGSERTEGKWRKQPAFLHAPLHRQYLPTHGDCIPLRSASLSLPTHGDC